MCIRLLGYQVRFLIVQISRPTRVSVSRRTASVHGLALVRGTFEPRHRGQPGNHDSRRPSQGDSAFNATQGQSGGAEDQAQRIEQQHGAALVQAEMEGVVKLKVPLVADLAFGPNWRDLK